MAASNNIINLFESEFDRLESSINGASKLPLHKKRIAAFNHFKSTGLPDFKDEEYKYTRLAKAIDKDFSDFQGNKKAVLGSEITNAIPYDLSPIVLVFVNGEYQEQLSRNIEVKGLCIESIKESEAADHFGNIADLKSDAYIAANAALALNGLFIKVDKSAIIEHPVVLVHIADSTLSKVMASPRNIFLAEENSQASVVEYFISHGEHASFVNSVSEINVKSNAIFSHHKIGFGKASALQIATTQIAQDSKSTVNTVTIDFDGKITRNNLNIAINGEHCEANMAGLYLTTGNSHIDNHSVVDHKFPNCNSNEIYKGILDDNSTGVFNGKIFVREDAQKTNAFQSNKNILTSDEARINTKPQLEIWADDVKCSHGCTTGQLDEEQLFYLRARGIGKKQARALLLKAFAEEVIDQIKIKTLKDHLEAFIENRISIE